MRDETKVPRLSTMFTACCVIFYFRLNTRCGYEMVETKSLDALKSMTDLEA